MLYIELANTAAVSFGLHLLNYIKFYSFKIISAPALRFFLIFRAYKSFLQINANFTKIIIYHNASNYTTILLCVIEVLNFYALNFQGSFVYCSGYINIKFLI